MIYNIPDHISGDTWIGIDSISIMEYNIPINLLDCEIYIQFRSDRNLANPSLLTLSTEDDTILITNPLSGIISIPPVVLNFPPETYSYDLQINFPNGTVKTYFGGSIKILPETTRIKNDITNKTNQKLILTGDKKEWLLTSDGERINYL